MTNRPTGTVTFLFTDIEGSTKLWEEHREAMQVALARHDALVRDAIGKNRGYVFKTIGDAFCAAFQTAADAVAAALAAQHALSAERWGETPLKVRMALLTGVAEERDGDYYGPPLNWIARLLVSGHGGQVLLSQAAYELARRDLLPEGVTLRYLGEHHLKDLARPEHIYQIVAPDLPSEFPPLKTLATLPNNLPIQLTSFIGREKEIDEIKRLLARTRLLTLTGAGGCGKTRLSLRVAAEAADNFGDGVWFIELAPLLDPELVPQTIAFALGLRSQSARPMLDALKDYLKEKNLLLVLDNCEHLIDACARVADALLHYSPGIRILATSREALNIAGETSFRVPSLALPDTKNLPPLESLMQYEAVRLFIDRALSIQTSFKMTNANATAIAEICQRLDGIPLAIELAAARIKALKPKEIAARLDDSFRLLTGGSRTALPRQQTLRAAIDWSYNLLSEPERMLVRRLSVFAGGATPAATEEICTGNGIAEEEILDLLTRLTDKSMLIVDASGEATRYRMLETIRQYAQEKLEETNEAESVRKRHCDFFLRLAGEAEPKLIESDQLAWLNRLESESDNMRLAHSWALQTEPVIALRLAIVRSLFWVLRAYLTEGRETLRRTLAKQKDVSKDLRAMGLYWLGEVEFRQGDFVNAKIQLKESLELFQELSDRQGISYALNSLGNVAIGEGDYATAMSLHGQNLSIRRELGSTWGVSSSLVNLGITSNRQGDYTAAQRFFQESLTIAQNGGDKRVLGYIFYGLGVAARGLGNYTEARRLLEEGLTNWRAIGFKWGFGFPLQELGKVALIQSDYDQARHFFLQSLITTREIGDKWGIAFSLEGFAKIASSRGRADKATRLLGATKALRESIGSSLMPAEKADYDRAVVAVRAQLAEDKFNALWNEGRAMMLEQAVEYALAEGVEDLQAIASAQPHDPNALTPREIEVLRLAQAGLSDAKIAENLVISPRTVNTHLSSIYSKLGVKSRSAATRYALDHKLI